MTEHTTAIAELDAIADPVERAQLSLVAMEEARSLMERIARVRAQAIYEVYQAHGGAKAARLLGISRVTLYRVLGQVPEVHERRVQNALELSAVFLAATSKPTDHGQSDRVS